MDEQSSDRILSGGRGSHALHATVRACLLGNRNTARHGCDERVETACDLRGRREPPEHSRDDFSVLHMANRERPERRISGRPTPAMLCHMKSCPQRQDSFLALLLLFAAARRRRRRLGLLRCFVLCLCAVYSGCVFHSSIFGGCAHVSCAHIVPGRVSIPSAFSGSAAICLPSLPTPAINLPTSALFSVLNFNVVPDTGSYAFTSRVALGTRGASSPVFSSVSAAVRFLFLLAYFSVSRLGMWYFVVMRACVVGKKNHIVSVVVQRASDELWTYAPWPGALGTAAWLVAAIPPWCRGTPSLRIFVVVVLWFSTRRRNRTRTGIASLSPQIRWLN